MTRPPTHLILGRAGKRCCFLFRGAGGLEPPPRMRCPQCYRYIIPRSYVRLCAHAGLEPESIRPCRELYRIKISNISNESPYSHQPQYTRARPKQQRITVKGVFRISRRTARGVRSVRLSRAAPGTPSCQITCASFRGDAAAKRSPP